MITNEQIIETSKANLETAAVLRTKAFAGVEKLVGLNVQAFKTSLSEAGDAATAATSVRTFEQFITLRNSIVKPMGGKVASYAHHVIDILSQTRAEMAEVYEGAFAENQRKVAAAVDTAVQNAPISGRIAESSMAAAKSVYDSVTKVAKQAGDAAEENLLALTTEAGKAARATKTVAAT